MPAYLVLMDDFFAYLLQFGSLNQHQLDLIARKTTPLSLPKEAYFLEAGQVSRRVGFLLEGVLRICYYDKQGREITRNFIDEHHLTTNLCGLEAGLASAERAQTLTVFGRLQRGIAAAVPVLASRLLKKRDLALSAESKANEQAKWFACLVFALVTIINTRPWQFSLPEAAFRGMH
ncbi:Crp/Fnr family transcriptional regulator [Hymenobacter sp. APR13]|uniref:Crp/Fnr family transcriptional regulator n=1 Tax=Hymenobacter sp. APR13 TaxID=1356852 RepID=UPI0004E09DE2|nr:Crp/Fnr family transcriptional regulator [Hymenobacter sp. APR13]AII50693.1 hypothetical protein N008_01670 [Hymenobacter sp. APR13]